MYRNIDTNRGETYQFNRPGIVRLSIAEIRIVDEREQARLAAQNPVSNPTHNTRDGIIQVYSQAQSARELAGSIDSALQAVEAARTNPIASSLTETPQHTPEQPSTANLYVDNDFVQAARSTVQNVYDNPEAAAPDLSTPPVVVATPEKAITTSTVVADGPTYPIPESRKDDWTPAA